MAHLQKSRTSNEQLGCDEQWTVLRQSGDWLQIRQRRRFARRLEIIQGSWPAIIGLFVFTVAAFTALGVTFFYLFSNATERVMRDNPGISFRPEVFAQFKARDQAMAWKWLIGCLIVAPPLGALVTLGAWWRYRRDAWFYVRKHYAPGGPRARGLRRRPP